MDLPSETSGAEPLPTPWAFPSSTRSLCARLWRLCDALATAAVRPRRGVLGHGLDLLGRRTKHFDRPAAALNLVDSLLPGAAAAWSRVALRRRKLPFSTSEIVLLGFGTGDTVFRLGPPCADMVLKIERRSLGLRPDELIALARRRRDAYATVQRQYRTVPGIIPKVRFLVVQSPLFGVPAVGALQPYVPGVLRDLLREVPETELESLAARRPLVRAQIVGFLEHTIAAWDRGGWIVDLGLRNVVLAGEGDDARLVYLDVEMKEGSGLRGTAREVMYENLMQRMRSMLVSIRNPGGRERHSCRV